MMTLSTRMRSPSSGGKHEIRSTKSETNSKHEEANSKREGAADDCFGHFPFGPLNLFRISCFGFRIFFLRPMPLSASRTHRPLLPIAAAVVRAQFSKRPAPDRSQRRLADPSHHLPPQHVLLARHDGPVAQDGHP